jgi:serine/threonine-protein kinase RsbW
MIGRDAASESRLVLASRVADTRRLHSWLDEAFARAPRSARLENAVRLCLEEAVMNVIMHGYGEGGDGEIELTLAREPGAMLATVVDSACPFDPLSAPLPPKHRPGLQQGPVGGRGLRLLRQFASGLEYQRCQGRNRLTLRFAD